MAIRPPTSSARALLTRQLLDAGLPEGLVNTVGGMIANVSDLVWSSGVQILVFLMGLLTIPQSHYEVAQVEGATGWEAFWKVTFPAVSPYILVGLVYSAIDHFIGYDNAVMKYITDNAYNNFRYSYAAAMSWIYFGAILLCLAVLVFITSRFIRYGGADDAPRGRGGPVMVKNKRASYANADSSPLYYLGRAVWSAVPVFLPLRYDLRHFIRFCICSACRARGGGYVRYVGCLDPEAFHAR